MGADPEERLLYSYSLSGKIGLLHFRPYAKSPFSSLKQPLFLHCWLMTPKISIRRESLPMNVGCTQTGLFGCAGAQETVAKPEKHTTIWLGNYKIGAALSEF